MRNARSFLIPAHILAGQEDYAGAFDDEVNARGPHSSIPHWHRTLRPTAPSAAGRAQRRGRPSPRNIPTLPEAGTGGSKHPSMAPTFLGTEASISPRQPPHLQVLPNESIQLLHPRPGYFYIDGTLGTGAQARRLLEHAPDTVLVGFDRDADSIALATSELEPFGSRAVIIHDDFKNWRRHEMPRLPLGGCFLDLGISSCQLDRSGRGFSFSRDEPLDMRMDPRSGPTAAELLNTAAPEELERIFREYGEVPFARRLSTGIVRRRHARPFAGTADFLDAIYAITGRRWRRSLNPATLPFMAVRIAVNGELVGLSEFLHDVADALAASGRLVVLAYHSLEDRIVKQTFRQLAGTPHYELLMKKPLIAGAAERARNPRARSAKLRALGRTDVPEEAS
ncbi:MAG: 16S rRNA (cytosine(1402)-N(4))-methyltransferase RsmH [Acidobacteriota bacterium]